MKIYKYLNILLLIIFIIGTIFSYENLPYKIELFMQSPSREVFVLINFVILLALAFVSLYPQKISRSSNQVRNELTIVVLNLLGTGIFLYYSAVISKYNGFQIDYLKVVALIIGILMILIGNFLPQMPFRSRIGFKLPWILKDKLCWQKTHRFAGYTAIPLGIIQCLLVLFFADNNMIFMFGTGFWIILVCVYSLFARSANQKN